MKKLYNPYVEEDKKKEVENLKVTDEDAEEEANKLAEKYQMKNEEFLKLFGGLDMVKYDLEMRAAMNVLKGE